MLQGRLRERHASMRVTMPRARTQDLVIEELGDELLVYDHNTKRAHCLGASAASVWRACDGERSVADLATALELSYETVDHALEELESVDLLDSPSLDVLNGNGNGNGHSHGITRRELTKRSAQVGGAMVAAPLILSITAPTAVAAATPTPFQCEIFTTQDCGASAGCGSIAGCCCCCQGGGSCKTCGSVKACNMIPSTQPCAPIQGGGLGSGCSDAKGTFPADPRGCCGVSGAQQCGCGFGPFAGCCHPADGTTCTPSSTDQSCFPCCHGQQITSAAVLGCCKSSFTNCCSATPDACCAKSTQSTDCCNPIVSQRPACCATGTCP